MSEITITKTAQADKRITVTELRGWLEELDRAGLDDTTQVRATVTVGGWLKTVTATA